MNPAYILVVVWAFLIMLLIRNIWLGKQCERMIRDDLDTYLKLESYDSMLLKFWIWDFKKFGVNQEPLQGS